MLRILLFLILLCILLPLAMCSLVATKVGVAVNDATTRISDQIERAEKAYVARMQVLRAYVETGGAQAEESILNVARYCAAKKAGNDWSGADRAGLSFLSGLRGLDREASSGKEILEAFARADPTHADKARKTAALGNCVYEQLEGRGYVAKVEELSGN